MARSLASRLSLPIFISILILGFAVDFFILRSFRQFFIESRISREARSLAYLAERIPDSLLSGSNPAALQDWALETDRALEQRVTVIRPDGTVLADSRVEPGALAALENHATRPEILALRKSELGYEVRRSETLRMSMLYIARPARHEGRLIGYLRFAVPLKEIDDHLKHQQAAVLTLTSTAFILMFLLVLNFTRRVGRVVADLGDNAKLVGSAPPGKRKYAGFSRESDLLYDHLDDTGSRIRALVADLMAQKEELEAMARARTDFVAAASHELRTPLTVLKGYVETLGDGLSGPAQAEHLDKIRRNVERLENLTEDLLRLGYLESGKIELKYDTVAINDMAGSIVDELKPLLHAKNLSVRIDCPEPVRSVPDLLHVALYNLLANAVRYNRPGGRIEVVGAQRGESYVIRVLDSGVGIPPEYRERVFERFFRIDKHRSRDTGGTGLGLAIVKHIAGTLKGTVRVVDGLDGGAGLELVLPNPV